MKGEVIMFEYILVPLDGSIRAEAALPIAARVARALVTSPAMILADEPTGNLDLHTSVVIITMLQQLNARGMTVVLVTHEPDIAAYCRRKVVLQDGGIVEDTVNPHPLRAQKPMAQPTEEKKEAPSKPTHEMVGPMQDDKEEKQEER